MWAVGWVHFFEPNTPLPPHTPLRQDHRWIPAFAGMTIVARGVMVVAHKVMDVVHRVSVVAHRVVVGCE